MEQLDLLAQALMLVAGGSPTKAMPQLSIHFDHNPTDLPEIEAGWKVSVGLTGLDAIDDTGNPVPGYVRSWSAIGATPNEAFNALVADLRSDLTNQAKVLVTEATAAKDAVTKLKGVSAG
jgi:hypothetical protein